MSENKNYLVPIAFLGLMFFSCGFALGINSLLVPVLQEYWCNVHSLFDLWLSRWSIGETHWL